MRERDRVCVLLFMEQGIERDKHLYTIGVGIANNFRQVLQRVTGRLSRTVRGCTDIDGVRTRLYCRNSYFFVASRSEEAKRYSTMPAVTDTFIECFVPYWGISMH